MGSFASIASHRRFFTVAFSFDPVAAMDARRPLLMLLFAMAAGAGYAQAPARTQPLAPPPPPPPDVLGNEELEPQVTINRTEDQTTEEVRVGGQLRYIRVTPRYGRPFYLIPEPNGMYIRRDGVDSTTKVPMWVLFSF
jgi:uncharacterized protein DUF2782